MLLTSIFSFSYSIFRSVLPQAFKLRILWKGQDWFIIWCLVSFSNSISVIWWGPMHLSMLPWSSFNQYSAQYSSQATGCFPIWQVSKQRSVVREEWTLSQWLINPRREYWLTRGLNQPPPVLKSATLPTELWRSAARARSWYMYIRITWPQFVIQILHYIIYISACSRVYLKVFFSFRQELSFVFSHSILIYLFFQRRKIERDQRNKKIGDHFYSYTNVKNRSYRK